MRFLACLIFIISSQWKEKSTRSTHPVTEGTYHFCSRGLGETIAFQPHLHAGKAKKFSAGQSAPVPSDHFITIEEGYSVLVSKLQSPLRPLILIFCPDSRKISSILFKMHLGLLFFAVVHNLNRYSLFSFHGLFNELLICKSYIWIGR